MEFNKETLWTIGSVAGVVALAGVGGLGVYTFLRHRSEKKVAAEIAAAKKLAVEASKA